MNKTAAIGVAVAFVAIAGPASAMDFVKTDLGLAESSSAEYVGGMYTQEVGASLIICNELGVPGINGACDLVVPGGKDAKISASEAGFFYDCSGGPEGFESGTSIDVIENCGATVSVHMALGSTSGTITVTEA